MKTTTTLTDVIEALSLTDADEVDVIEDAATAVIRKGAVQMVVQRNDDNPGFFTVGVHAHVDGPNGESAEDEAHTCHAWKVGMVANPVGSLLSQMFGQAFNADPAGGDGFYL